MHKSADLMLNVATRLAKSSWETVSVNQASRWALLVESLRWAARGHDFLSTWAESAQGLPKDTAATETQWGGNCFSQTV